jgi:two-component system response regulator NreC
LLVDDHQIVRQCLRSLLEREADFTVIGEAADGAEGVRLAALLTPEVVVMDVHMPLMNGLDAAHEIMRVSRRIGVVLLTMQLEDPQVLMALRAGIRGFVLKSQAGEELVQAIHDVARGEFYLSPGASQTVVEAFLTGGNPGPDPLTPREREVLRLVAEGKSTKEIAGVLQITPKTAETYRGRLMEKLAIHDTANLVRYAIRQGLVVP